jgi:type II secretory pathway component PulF
MNTNSPHTKSRSPVWARALSLLLALALVFCVFPIQEVKAATDALMSMLEPLLVIFLGGIVGFIVIALFMPLISLITHLSN